MRHQSRSSKSTLPASPGNDPLHNPLLQKKWDSKLARGGMPPELDGLGPGLEQVPHLLHDGLIRTRSGGRKKSSPAFPGAPTVAVGSCTCAPPWEISIDPKTGVMSIEVCDKCRAEKIAQGY